MVKYELLGIKQRPENVIQHLLGLCGGDEERFQLRRLLLGGFAAQATQVEVLDDLVGLLALLEQLLHHAALLDLRLERVAVEQVQRLRQVGVDLHLARANGGARRPAEGGQEIVGSVDRKSTRLNSSHAK